MADSDLDVLTVCYSRSGFSGESAAHSKAQGEEERGQDRIDCDRIVRVRRKI